MEAENENVTEQDCLDLIQLSTEMGEEDEDILFQWIRPAHLDDEHGNPDPEIAARAREHGINIDRVMAEEVGNNESGSDSFERAMQGVEKKYSCTTK